MRPPTTPGSSPGEYRDAEINQYYLRARQYDPTMMRFTSRDPVRGEPKEPLTLHKYLYCLNDPIGRVDLSGENSIAKTLVAPVVAGHTAHALAVTAVAYGVSVMDWSYIDLGITIDMNLSTIISMACLGASPIDSIDNILKQRKGEYKRQDEGARAFYEMVNRMENRMSGKEPPKGFWAKVVFYSSQLASDFRDLFN